eukprot:c19222_g1_i4.p1 GENE.c19222_g1_i4~~c19222_g1_i4.p1  ORF type:complete len:213 (+),score=38.35 c19222_g1_i4:43-681(+)
MRSILVVLGLVGLAACANPFCTLCCETGSCSRAFRDGPGKCCGRLPSSSTPFCCPSADSMFGDFDCNDQGTCHAANHHDNDSNIQTTVMSTIGVFLGIMFLVCVCAMCLRRQQQQPVTVYDQNMTTYPGYGAQPPTYGYGGGAAYGQPVYYNQQQGYSGAAMAAGVGAGVVGGVVLGSVLANNNYGDSGYGGGAGVVAADFGTSNVAADFGN